MTAEKNVARSIGVEAGRMDSEAAKHQNQDDCTASLVRFSATQYEAAQGLPRMATEPVVCSALGVNAVIWRWWKVQGWTPQAVTLVNGSTAYERSQVLAFMARHMEADR